MPSSVRSGLDVSRKTARQVMMKPFPSKTHIPKPDITRTAQFGRE
jgi:hypothetical protein